MRQSCARIFELYPNSIYSIEAFKEFCQYVEDGDEFIADAMKCATSVMIILSR